ncbi:MAG: ABC transporter substrate-binding protein [Negativibacillus sp.]|nr:ABC transporter substrate-binding protein [Negativibacillus sp.]
MKKFMSIMMAGMMMATMAGCSNGTEQKSGSADSAGKLQIGVVQIMEHTSLDTIRESFLAEMESLGYGEDKVEFDIQNAQGEQTNLSSICKKFVGDNVDMIVAIATPTAQAAAASTSDIPIVFSAVTDPVEAKLVADPEHPDKNLTGTSDAIPVDEVMQLCQKLTPDVKKIGFMYTTSEINSQVTAEKAIQEAEKMGYETQLMTISEVSELQQAAQSLAQNVDAIYVPIDNTIAQAMKVLAQVGLDYKIPIYTGADSMVQDGGFATVGIEYDKLGQQTAKMAKSILEGTPVSEVPVETLDEFGTFINKSTAEAIGVEIPAEIADNATLMGE